MYCARAVLLGCTPVAVGLAVIENAYDIYLCFHSGFRLLANAVMPSVWSSVAWQEHAMPLNFKTWHAVRECAKFEHLPSKK